jgi:hypothetical protein
MTRLVNSRRARLLAVLGAALLGAGAAWGFWIGPATGTATGDVGSLSAPSGVEASAPTGKTTVSVSWTASAGAISPTGYYVERWSGGTQTLAGGACGSPGSPASTTSCEEANVPDGTYTYTVVAVYRSWTAASAHSASVTVLRDSTPPTTSLATEPASPDGSGGWFREGSVPFKLSATDAGTGVAATFYTLDGGATQTYSKPVSVSGEGAHTVEYWSKDNAGNVEAHHAAHIKLDGTAPTDALSLGEAPVHAYLSGSTLYFASSLGGSFTLVDSVSDAGSGAASAAFPALGAAHWVHAAQVVTSPAGGPFASSTYSWSAGAAAPSAAERTVTSADAAGNPSAGSALTFAPDSQAPAGGALAVNGTTATPTGSTSSSASSAFTIGSRTDYQEAQGAGQSGLRSSTLTVQSATLAKNVCGTPGSGGAYTSPTVITGTANPATATGYCYLYTLTGTDNVGNAASVSTTVKVDTTAPSSPAVQLSGATGSTFLNGTTVYVNAQAGRSGSFLATGSAADAESGIATIALPALSGFEAGGGTLSAPFETTYKWSGAVAASGAQSATATDGAGLTETNAAAFTVVQDTTAPSGGTVSVPARSKATSVSVTFSAGTDNGSGIAAASGELLRAEANYTATNDSCGTFGTFSKVGAAAPSSPFSDATVASGRCYAYEYKVSDNVGNAATYGPSEAVKVNTAGPSLTGISSTNGNGILETGDTLTLTFSDQLSASSIPASGKIVQKKTGVGAMASEAITGITSGTEGWSTGVSSGYQEKSTEAEYNETASVSGNTVKVTVGSKVKGSGTIAGSTGTATGVVLSSVKDLFENAASTGTFSLSAKFW